MNRLTPESKATLRKTIRHLRDVLLRDLRGYAEQRYLLGLDFKQAKGSLSQPMQERRRRLEDALAERAAEEGNTKEARDRALDNAVKEAGATLLNRLVLIRHLEAVGLSRPVVVTGGWKSIGYVQFRELAPGLIEDETQGYALLLQLLFDELSAALPGLFGEVGLTALFPPSPATLRAVIEALDEVPDEAWHDDMTLGWVYQYWNDPDREALDAKLHERGKLEPHEIASKTQMFTERYMVEWLLQNSLGPTWLAMCRKNDWEADAERLGVLKDLDARRAEWRRKREAGEVAPDALMPVEGALEESWKYYVPQPLPEAVVAHAPKSIRDLKLLDPACGSGHFLVVAFDLLVELYREEARHLGETWGDRQIAEWILENNLHGVDIDPRAVQIAAAAVFLKARTLAKDADPKQVNLVAPALRLAALPANDPSLLKLEKDLEAETGLPPRLTQQLVEALAGVDHLGTLLKLGDAVDQVLAQHGASLERRSPQQSLFGETEPESRRHLTKADAKELVLARLNAFLAHHQSEEDLGLRLRGQQLASGVRFATIVREGEYHLVVANPPYQGTSRMKDARYIAKHYPRGKSDLYAAFLERGLELCRPGGASAMVTMRSWMFLSGFTALREHLLETFDLRALGDVDRGAFDEVPNEVLATAMSVFRKMAPSEEPSVAMQPTPLSDKSYDRNRTARKRAAVLAQVGRFEFDSSNITMIPGSPIVYWWHRGLLEKYLAAPKLGQLFPIRKGIITGDDQRFNRMVWETRPTDVIHIRTTQPMSPLSVSARYRWVPTIKGGEGREWVEPLTTTLKWHLHGLEQKVLHQHFHGSFTKRVQSQEKYFEPGVAFSMIGNSFAGRLHRFRSVFANMGSSVFPGSAAAEIVCSMNTSLSRGILESLNPGLHFEVGDVARLPVWECCSAKEILSVVDQEFCRLEAGRECSVEFKEPSGHAWEATQDWAQRAVDRPDGAPLPDFVAVEVQPEPEAWISFRVGIALGRFGKDRSGIQTEAPAESLPNGILYLSPRHPLPDSPAMLHDLHEEWEQRSGEFNSESLEDWLRDHFFEYHRKLYENRPIYFPLASAKRSFLAYVSIHRWTDTTLSTLLAEHLIPERRALEGALVDLQSARSTTDKKARTSAEKSYHQHRKWLEELEDFIQKVHQLAEKGPPPVDANTEPREVDAPYRMDLDDGVMVNSAALWPVLEPMWKDPKKWWKELANAKGRKDYDWSHLAARYFPSRVDEKCRKDPSLGVAHGCFWKYHPEKAFQWELRLQDEIGPDFTLDEPSSDALRAAFLEAHPDRAEALRQAEQARRERKARKQDQEELELGENDDAIQEDDEGDEAASA